MMKNKVQPTDFKTAEEYRKAMQSRKGSTDRRKPTVTLRDIYAASDCEMSFKDWKNLIDLLHKAMREIIVKGNSIPIPFFGILEYAEKECQVKHWETSDGRKFTRDQRHIDFNKFLENEFRQAHGEENLETAKRNGKKLVIKALFASYFKFIPMKYMVRELKNNILGTEYKIIR